MSDTRRARVKEQAEAYLHHLRTIPRSEAVRIMEQVLDELFKYREMYTAEKQYSGDRSCDCEDKS